MIRLLSFISFSLTITVALAKFDIENNYVIGGTPARLGQFPHMVSIRRPSNQHYCGGAILNTRWVVTAAHCFENDDYYLVIGSTNVRTGGVPHIINNTVLHPRYDPFTRENDVALLQTKTSIEFTDVVKPIQIGPSPKVGDIVQISGWGRVGDGTIRPMDLMYMNTTIISNLDCQSRLPLLAASSIFDTSICTLKGRGFGICYGDSGSPLISNEKVVAVVAWTIPCGHGGPDVYVNLSHYIRWIAETITM